MSADDYGSHTSGAVLVDQSGPHPPPPFALEVAQQALDGKLRVRPCLDCAPNLVLKDFLHRGQWEWGAMVAHDDTCPVILGIVQPSV
jgi:hypothetical protein